jgi:hypothetical protein
MGFQGRPPARHSASRQSSSQAVASLAPPRKEGRQLLDADELQLGQELGQELRVEVVEHGPQVHEHGLGVGARNSHGQHCDGIRLRELNP